MNSVLILCEETLASFREKCFDRRAVGTHAALHKVRLATAAAGKRRESPAYARLTRALGELSALVRRCAGCPNKGLSAFAEEIERLTARWRDRLAP